jgi:hypothetical protein
MGPNEVSAEVIENRADPRDGMPIGLKIQLDFKKAETRDLPETVKRRDDKTDKLATVLSKSLSRRNSQIGRGL